MDFVSEYAANVDAVLQAIWREERPAIDEAGRMLADSLAADGILYVFGCGHSHMIEEGWGPYAPCSRAAPCCTRARPKAARSSA